MKIITAIVIIKKKYMVQSKYIQKAKTKEHKNSKLSSFVAFYT